MSARNTQSYRGLNREQMVGNLPGTITRKSAVPSAGLTKHHKGRITMKRLLLAFITLAAAAALTVPAFAGLKDAKNKAECEKAGGVWVEKDDKCGAKTE